MSELFSWLQNFWPHGLGFGAVAVGIVASIHVLLNKPNALSAIAWMGMIWLVPLLGPLLYLWFGINRVQRRARLLRQGAAAVPAPPCDFAVSDEDFPQSPNWRALKELMDRLTGQPLLQGNRVDILHDGNQAYPAMLQAVEHARHSVALGTYIFGNDAWGQRFIEALLAAQERGVEVRVLIDGAGQYYSWPLITPRLRACGIPHALFLHSFLPWRMPYLNLRNHRKVLVVDGCLGFTGGLNIRDHHVGEPPRARDLHFMVRGPVVAHMMKVFAEDWYYTCLESLEGEPWVPQQSQAGKALARGIQDGPDEDYDKFRWALLAGLGQAQDSVLVMTPYFIPDDGLQTALKHAALRGVKVDLILPAKNNWPFMRWASNVSLPSLLEAGCRVWLSPPPFDHSKIMVVDEVWVLLGSGNWDPRSFRLNFEFNLEVYDAGLAADMLKHARAIMEQAQPLTAAALEQRPLWHKLRDGLTHLFSSYL